MLNESINRSVLILTYTAADREEEEDRVGEENSKAWQNPKIFIQLCHEIFKKNPHCNKTEERPKISLDTL